MGSGKKQLRTSDDDYDNQLWWANDHHNDVATDLSTSAYHDNHDRESEFVFLLAATVLSDCYG
jgi:hypothetical protein